LEPVTTQHEKDMADDKARLKKKKPSGGGRTSPDAPMSVPEGYMNGRKKEKEKNREQFRAAARMRRRELYGDDPHGFKEKAAGMTPEQKKECEKGIKTLKMFQKARHGINRANERTLTKPEKKEKEKVVKGMKKNKPDFKKRYGKDAESVMYATATKIAKEKKS